LHHSDLVFEKERSRPKGRRGILPLLLAFFLLHLLARSSANSTSSRAARILSNVPFEARAEGLLGAVEVEMPQGRAGVDVSRAISCAIDREQARLRAGLQRFRHHWGRLRRLPPDGRVRFSKRMVWVENGAPLLPDRKSALERTQRLGDGSLNFNYEGWTSAERQQLSGYVNAVYPIMVSVYGQPAFDLTVTIRQDPELTILAGGIYDATRNEIRIPPLLPGSFAFDSFNLAHLILQAFHDDVMFSFEAWEEGFARAAALLVHTRYDPTFEPGNPNASGGFDSFYMLSIYDFLNAPGLGNAVFFSPSASQTAMGEFLGSWRLGMCEAAWLKVAAENPNFFKSFNEAYYSQYYPSLEGNIPALKQLAASVVPTVEGLTFTDWYRRQYVLDTSITLGRKLYVASIPMNESVSINLHLFTTSPDGDETPQGGTAHLVYSNYASDDLFAEEGYETDIPAIGEDAGYGYISPSFYNIGGPSRVRIDIAVGPLATTVFFPYNVSGPFGGDPFAPFNPLFGTVLGSDEGSIILTGGYTGTANIVHGVFYFTTLPKLTSPTKVTIEYTADDTEQTTTLQKNMGWEYSAILFPSPASVKLLSHRYTKGLTGYQMISLPGRPLVSDEAAVFGVPPNRFLMARWRPEMAGENKYELYPNITTPLAPGVGAWVKLENDVNVSVQAEPISTEEDFRIHLPSGFNQIGVPVEASFNLADLFVQVPGGVPQSFGAAQAAGLVSGGVFEFSQAEGYRLTTTLSPWNGYWLRVTSANGIDLIFPTQGMAVGGRHSVFSNQCSVKRGTGSASPSRILPGTVGMEQKQMRRNDWSFRLSASTSIAKDLDNYLGVTPRATDGFDTVYDIVQPPEFGPFVSLYFPSAGGQGPMPLAVDLRSPFAGKKQWDFEVMTNLGDTEVTLTWDDLRKAPAGMKFRLADLDARSVLDMRKVGFYRFRTGNSAVRHFRVVVFSGAQPAARISDVNLQRTPHGLLVTFRSSQPVEAEAEIYTLRGQRIRAVKAKAISAEGDYAFSWDWRDMQGQPAREGVYLVRFTIKDEARGVQRLWRIFHLRR